MSRRNALRTPLFAVALAFALACGSGGKTDNDPGDESTELPDVTPDEGDTDDGKDVPGADEGVVTDDSQPGDPGRDDAETQTDEGDTDDGKDDGDADSEVIVIPPLCPCDETIADAEVCLRDPVTKVRTEFKSDVCAKCAQCAPDPTTCKGCSGTKADCADLPAPNYFTWKGDCDACPCRKQDECDRIVYPGCGKVCAMKGGVQKEYDDLCAMKNDFDCDDDYDENILNFGPCPPPACEPCLGLSANPVCGSDGTTYRNQCELANAPECFGAGAVTRACLGACIGADFCAACPAECSPVCGDDGVTYGSSCAATKCGTKDKLVAYTGACCPECDQDPALEVCATDGKAYRNLCQTLCQGATPCGDTGTESCGLDGTTYPNTCWATCKAGGQLHSGECTRVCEQCPATLTPVCALDAENKATSYQSECFKACRGGTGGTAGLCSSCTTICGTIASPTNPVSQVCGADGITYPNSCFPEKCFGITFTAGACN